MKKIEDNNTLVFIVDKMSNKNTIKAAVKKLYDIDVQRVNTLIRLVGSSLGINEPETAAFTVKHRSSQLKICIIFVLLVY